MEYAKCLSDYDGREYLSQLPQLLDRARQIAAGTSGTEVWKSCFSCLDLTSLGSGDTAAGIADMVGRAVRLRSRFADMPDVAAVCVYPAFVDTACLEVGGSGISVASVAGGFPAAATYLEVKMLEVAMAVENGADEIDTVMEPGRLVSGDYDALGSEIELLKDEMGAEVLLKVIIESGTLSAPETIFKASLLAMYAGADFVKTSTGKTAVSATPEAAVAICMAIKAYYEKTGRRVGFKAAGGIRRPEEAVLYRSIVDAVLGPQWLAPSLFRIGASSLADALLSAIEGREVEYFG